MPTAVAQPTAQTSASARIRVRHPATTAMPYVPSSPSPSPLPPPSRATVTASARNWVRISRSRAPTARRRPISRVRSVTGHEHDIQNANAAHQQCNRCHTRQEERHRTLGGGAGLGNLGGVPQVKIILLAWSHPVPLAQQRGNLGFGQRDGLGGHR